MEGKIELNLLKLFLFYFIIFFQEFVNKLNLESNY